MARTATSKSSRARLPPAKGAELIGIGLLLLAVLLGLGLATYHPDDPSLLFDHSGGASVRNLVGPIGEQLSAVAFGLLGLSSLILPVLLGVAGWRRLRRLSMPPVAGRGVVGDA